MENLITIEEVEAKLQLVFDPEFPLIDIFTMGLIYDIKIDNDAKEFHIVMTLTTPACPAWEQIQEGIKTMLMELAPDFKTHLTLTFEPMRSIEMIKDEDLKRMFF